MLSGLALCVPFPRACFAGLRVHLVVVRPLTPRKPATGLLPRQLSLRLQFALVALCVCACLWMALSCPPPSPLLQLWGNATHIAPELHREANRVSNSALVAELHFDKQVSSAVRVPYQCHRGGKTGSCVMASPAAVPAVAV